MDGKQIEGKEEKSLIIFGRDVSKIPCFRNSFLYGICGGLTFGLAHFLFTSRSLRSVNYSVYSFVMITTGYWIQCRYNYAVQKFEMMKLQELMAQRALYEGTEHDVEMKEKPEFTEV